jgi:hypothetical protein
MDRRCARTAASWSLGIVCLGAVVLSMTGCKKRKSDGGADSRYQGYVGSASCAPCHGPYPDAGGPAHYADWLTTRHARTGQTAPSDTTIVADANANAQNDFKESMALSGFAAWSAYAPNAPVLGFDAPRGVYTLQIGPRTFDVEKVAGVGRHQQLYLTRMGSSLYVLPALYDAEVRTWRTYAPESWYTWTDTNADGLISGGETVTGVRYGPLDTPVSLGRTADSWEASCVGCHATGVTSLAANGSGEYVSQVTEDGAGCESCHGPGRLHVLTLGGEGYDDRAIVNPATLTTAQYNDVCMSCHTRGQSTGTVGGRKLEFPWRTDGAAFVPGQALTDAFTPGDKAVEPLHRLQGTHIHRGLAGSRYGAWTTGCNVCHEPHFATNLSLVRSSIQTPNSGARTVVFTRRSGAPGSGGLMGDATDVAYTDVCEVCHTKTAYFRNNAGTPVKTHNNGAACTDCHLHWRGFPPLESPGGRDCSQCHPDLVAAMEDATATGYHHLLGSSSATVPMSAATTKNCLSCHADHDIFSPALNVANGGRGKNLRTDITLAPTTAANFTNSDFVNAGTGGICLSCHTSPLAKGYPQPDGTTASGTPAIPYTGAGAAIYNGSPHGTYAAASSFSDSGTSAFAANCSKCHNDTMSPKSGVLAQSGPFAFGNHDSILRQILDPLGLASPSDPLGDAFCYRCHSLTIDVVGGTRKPVAGRDWYNAAGMSSGSEGIYQLFASKANRHVATGAPGPHHPIEGTAAGWNAGATRHVGCTDCHNPHAAGVPRNFNTSGTFAQPVTPASTVSGPLRGVWGVNVAAWPAAWAAPAITRIDSCTDEWQVCLKCHSSYAYGGTPPAGQSNIAAEFNPNNPSYHAVAGASKTTEGTYVAPWTLASRMACSDCHTTDVKTEPQGPHGSAHDVILAGAFDTTTGAAGTSGHLCYKCHDYAVYSTGAGGTGTGFRSSAANLHGRHLAKNKPGAGRAVTCRDCHAAVPHGMSRDALLVFQGDPAPYNDGNATITSVAWKAPGSWDKASCATLCHNESSGGQDCDGCHHDLVIATTSVAPTTYHHLLAGSGVGYPTGAASKTCLSCHADHDLFRPDLNAAGGRGKNLRTDIALTPTAATSFTNTDFVNAGTGGICLSCHAASLSKGYTQPDGTTTVPAIPYAGAAPGVYNGSPHGGNYAVASAFSDVGTNTFSANCSKCHNDTLSPKSDKIAQTGPYAFGNHESLLRQVLAPLGLAAPADPVEETFCYRCHATTADAVGGTKKTVAGRDWYNAAAMSVRAEGIYARVTANTGSTYSHPVGGASGRHHPVEEASSGWNTGGARHVECVESASPWKTWLGDGLPLKRNRCG